MVVGNMPQTPRSIFDAAYPLPALIANNYGEMMSVPLYECGADDGGPVAAGHRADFQRWGAA